MGDLYTYETSSRSQLSDEPFQNKIYNYVQDLNNSNNPTQIKFQLDGFRSSDKFVNPSEMFISIPIVLAMARDSADSAGFAAGLGNLDFAFLLKNGYWNLINSMSVMIDNKECVQITPNLNYFANFKVNSSYSADDLQSGYGALGNYPDSSTSWTYNPVGTVTKSGEGLCNNQISPSYNATMGTASYVYGDYYNTGAFARTYYNNIRVDGTANSKWNGVKTASQFQAEAKNYLASSDASVATAYRVQYITANIRLKDLSDIFEKLPLLRGFNCTLTLNLNMGNVKVWKNGTTGVTLGDATSTTTAKIASNVAVSNGGSIPFMVTRSTTDWTSTTDTQTGYLSVGCYYASVRPSGVGNQSSLNIPAHPLTTARCYAPLITLQPERALSYLSENKKKLVVYRDLLYFYQPNVTAGSSFNYQLAPSINNMKSIVVIPNLGTSVLGIQEGQSPFDSCPATTAPLSIYNFNVQVASQNVLQQNIQYGIEQYFFETFGANSVNGSQSVGVNSSLFGFADFENIYKYYYVNLARRLPSDTLGKSVSIVGQNNNSLAMDLYIFIEIEKSLIIDTETGKVEELRV